MALNIFTGATDDNWGTATNWSQGTVPTSTDTYITTFDATSPNCTVNTTVRFCNGIDFSTYVNTITMTNIINVYGDCTLGVSMTIAGAAGLTFNATSTLTSNGKTWPNDITLGSVTYTFADVWTITGTVSCGLSAVPVINGSTINVGGSVSFGNNSVTGTATIVMNGTGTLAGGANTAIRLNITFDTAGTITIGNFYFGGATLTYVTGTMVISGSLSLGQFGGTIINTSGMTWASIGFATSSTVTLTSNLNCSGNVAGNGITLNGLFDFNIGGSFTINSGGFSGTTSIVLNGTGTLSGTGILRNNLTINTAGTITISDVLSYITGTLTHTAGTVDTSGSTLSISASTTLDTSGMTWNNILTSGTSATITLLSDLYVRGTITLASGGNPIWTGNTMYIGGNLIHQTNSVHSGTTAFVMNGTGTYSSASINCIIRNNFTINTTGKITFGAIVAYNTGTFTYLSGKVVVPKNAIMYIAASTTLINCHKINFETVQITAGTTTTMNEFFSGSPNKPVKVQSSSTVNYNIAFQNGYQKISKFVKISNMTLINTVANRGSLLILNSKGKYFRGSNNVGNIKYTNQSPNGIAKGEPTVPNQMTVPIGGYVSDPIFN